jgi:hypothetical protein
MDQPHPRSTELLRPDRRPIPLYVVRIIGPTGRRRYLGLDGTVARLELATLYSSAAVAEGAKSDYACESAHGGFRIDVLTERAAQRP